MRRALRLIPAFLLLGALLNIAVAWSFSQPPLLRVLRTPSVVQTEPPTQWPRQVPSTWPAAPEETRIRRVGPGYRDLDSSIAIMWYDPPEHWVGFRVYELLQMQIGWPLKALERESSRDFLLRTNATPAISPHTPLPSWRGGITINGHRYPIRPLWPGFAINTLFYSAAAGALFLTLITAARTIRRTRRKAADRCPTCGYPRAGLSPSTPCPECGGAPAR